VSVPFRDVPKDGIEIRLPRHLATTLRERAARERRSISDLGSELIIRGLGHDPANCGIKFKAAVPVTP
jgi:hypothetical protein